MSKAIKKGKGKSAGTLIDREYSMKLDARVPPMDMLVVKILSLRLQEKDPPYYAIKVSFYDWPIISAIIKPLGMKDKDENDRILAKGTMSYDPADYEKMTAFADQPLIVQIQPLKSVERDSMEVPSSTHLQSAGPDGPRLQVGRNTSPQKAQTPEEKRAHMMDVSCCNVDILPLFLDMDKICVKKRLQPMVPPKVMHSKSWDNLPLLVMGITAVRNEENAQHHKFLEEANWLKISVVGAYNMLVPYESECLYTAASKLPIYNDLLTTTVTYSQGSQVPRNFNSTSFYPKWESALAAQELFAECDDKLHYSIEDIYNPEDINLKYYLEEYDSSYTTIWGSFHRSLMLGKSSRWLWKHLRRWQWPVEVHFYGDSFGGYSFMGFLDLFPFLYPGTSKMLIAVPLHWHNPRLMMDKCNCPVLMLPNEKTTNTPRKPPLVDSGTPYSGTSTETGFLRNTGADDGCGFVLVEVQFGRPMVSEHLPQYIRKSEMMNMLLMMESGPEKRACTGRGQRAPDWLATVRSAARSLRRVPYHGLTEFCHFNRQLSETRCRVELLTSFWMEAAIYTNNHFHVQPYLQSDEQFEELLMMSHVCLMKMACDELIDRDDYWLALEPTLRAARHARQLHDIPHALDLYLQMTVKAPFNGDIWRELSTCLKDVDRDWADICITKATLLDIRHPLTLISKGCMVFEENPDDAEPFFLALLAWYPFWATGYYIASAYFHTREFYCLADEIINSLEVVRQEHLLRELNLPRAWQKELGDFWESTLLLPGMSPYYDAADLLLRLRGIRLAEVCLGLALARSGETAVHYHLVALCYRLQGDLEQALCLVRTALEKYGQNTYLGCLEAECLHEMGDVEGAISSFEKVGGGLSPHSILLSLSCWEPSRVRTVLVDLLRRQPTAYAWMALSNDWLLRVQQAESNISQLTEEEEEALECACACAEQALRWDRYAGRAWATLAKLVKPQRRRRHCFAMANECGFQWAEEDFREMNTHSQQSVCHRLGYTFKECRCSMCDLLTI